MSVPQSVAAIGQARYAARATLEEWTLVISPFANDVSGEEYARCVSEMEGAIRSMDDGLVVCGQKLFQETRMGGMLIAYPPELLKDMRIPSSASGVDVGGDVGAAGNPIWLDFRMRDRYSVGDTVSLKLTDLSPVAEFADALASDALEMEFQVAGFLNRENAHWDLSYVGAAYPTLTNAIRVNSAEYVFLAPDMGQFADAATIGGMVFVRSSPAISPEEIATRAEELGVGYGTSGARLRSLNTSALFPSPGFMMICALAMLLLTVIGSVSMQVQMQGTHVRAAFAMMLCGMRLSRWYCAWLVILVLPACIAAGGGVLFGVLYATVPYVGASRRHFLFPMAYITAGVTCVSALALLPTLRRWNSSQLIRIGRAEE